MPGGRGVPGAVGRRVVIFRPEFAAKVMDGSKTVTRRLCSENPRSPWWVEKCGYQVGGVYAVQPGRKTRVGMLAVHDVRRQQLGRLTPIEARMEGFASPSAFAAEWEKINGSYDPHSWVWRVQFVAVGE